MDSPQVLGDILAMDTVAAGSAGGEDTINISQGDRQPINFVLTGQVKFLPGDQFLCSGVPGDQLVINEGVSQGEQGERMFHDTKGFNRGSTNSLGGRIRSEELRIFLFQFPQFPHQSIIFGIADFRVVQNIVAVVVVINLRPQFIYSLLDFVQLWHDESLKKNSY